MARSIFVLAGILLALSISAQADHTTMFCDYGLFLCANPTDPTNVTCISYTRVCDGIADCCDSADEAFCGDCPTNSIQCPNTTICVNNTAACDGNMDCPNGEDEAVSACGCQENGYVPVCRDMNNTAYCINETQLCDGSNDCMNGEDEQFPYCPQVCGDNQISCFGNGTFCFEVFELCNGVFECPNAFDEGNCTTSAPESPFCPYGTYYCEDMDQSGKSCINYTRVCDGVVDCFNGTDESLCGGCSTGFILCPNTSNCIENTRACDGISDCMDGCDESVGACGCINEYQVPVCRDMNGNPYCINETQLCDGCADCMNGEDEQFPYCPELIVCGPEELTCSDLNTCVNITDVCSGNISCSSIYEVYCVTTPSAPQFCPYGTYNCARSGDCGDTCCLNYTDVCDGECDCLSGSDEFKDICGNCSVGMIQCPESSVCVNNTVICDGNMDCPYGRDETVEVCGCIEADYVPVCRNYTGELYCIHTSQICDGVPDCVSGEDESDTYGCTTATPPPSTTSPPTFTLPPAFSYYCPLGEFLCRDFNSTGSTECISNEFLCNGYSECYNNTDELDQFCCSEGRFRCHLDEFCINNTQVCDGIVDCPSETDENQCDPFTVTPPTTTQTPLITTTPPPSTTSPPTSGYYCPLGEFLCRDFNSTGSTECISNEFLCNGYSECYNNTDEEYCCSEGRFRCHLDEVCINNTQVCDGNFNCPSGTDEYLCGPTTATPPTQPPIMTSCPLGEVPCPTDAFGSFECLSNRYICDGTTNCYNGIDEQICGGCPTNEFLCPNNSSCINNTYACDGVSQCPSAFDESICGVPSTTTPPTVTPPQGCPNGSYPCGVNQTLCWRYDQACDGYNDCGYELAFDEIPDFVERFGVACTVNETFRGNELVFGLLAPPLPSFIQFPGIPLLENMNDTEYCFVRGGLSSLDPFTITLSSNSLGATPDVDYVNLDGTVLTFGRNDHLACFNISIINDDIIEDFNNEQFDIVINIEADVNYTYVGLRMATFLIIDELEGANIELRNNRINASEVESTQLMLCAVFNGTRGSELQRDVVFNISQFEFASGSATVGLDYLLFNESTIIFPRNSSLGDEQCIVFGMVLDDDVIESVETAYLFPVSTFFTDRFFVNGVPASIEVTIYSDEFVEFRFANDTPITIMEGNSTTICLVVESNVTEILNSFFSLNLDFDVVGGNATEYTDFSLSNQYHYFSSRADYEDICVTISTSDDSNAEDIEELVLSVRFGGSSPARLVGDQEVVVTIVDNDEPIYFSFINDTGIEIYEGSGTIICVQLLSNLTEILSDVYSTNLNFVAAGITATAYQDFSYTGGYHTLSRDTTTDVFCVSINANNDDLAEDLEELNVTVTGNLVRLVGEQALVLTIVDTDSCRPGSYPCGNDPTRCWTTNQACDGVNDCGDELAHDEISAFVERFGVTCTPTDSLRGNDLIIGLLSPPLDGVVSLQENSSDIEVCILRGATSSRDTSFNVTISNNPLGAMPNVDYELTRTELNFNPDDDIDCFNITVINDDVIEDQNNEMFSISLSVQTDDNYTFIGAQMATFRIMDDAEGVVVAVKYINVVGTEIEETQLMNCLTLVEIDGMLERDATFILGQSCCGSSDFMLANEPNRTITFSSSSAENDELCITFGTVIDDTYFEPREEYITFSFNAVSPTDKFFNDTNEFRVTIINDELIDFEFINDTQLNVTEGEGFQVCIALEGSVNLTELISMGNLGFSLNFVVSPRTATTSDYYTSGRYHSLYTASDFDDLCVSIQTIDDNFIEEDPEEFVITVDFSSSPGQLLGPQEVVVTIVDNDEPVYFQFVSPYLEVSEGGSGRVCVVPVSSFNTSLLLNFTVSGTTATTNDFSYSSNQPFYIYPSSFPMDVCVTIYATDDQYIENSEQLVVTIDSDRARLMGEQEAIVTILDNDVGQFMTSGFVDNVQNEGDWNGETPSLYYCVSPTDSTRDNLRRNVNITFWATDITAVEGEDYILDGRNQMYFYGANGSVCAQVRILNDVLIENTESFTVSVGISDADFTFVGSDTSTVEITNDDMGQFDTTGFMNRVENESDWTMDTPSIRYCLSPTDNTRSNLRRNVNITFWLNDSTAIEGEDYEFSGHSQTYYYFNITSNSMTMTPVCAELRILNDRVIEYTESFSVSVHISDATFTLVGSDTSTVQITSDDTAQVQLVVPSSVNENVGSFNVSVMLTDVMDGLERDIDVFVNLQDGELLLIRRKRGAPMDFSPLGLQTLTIPSQSTVGTVVSIEVFITDDNYIEDTETIQVTLEMDSAGVYTVSGERNQTVLIEDNDGAELALSTREILILEGGAVEVMVFITDGAPRFRDVVVNVSVQLETADSGDIGTYTRGLVFTPSDNSLTVTIPITSDNVVGEDEVFVIVFTPENPLDQFTNGSSVRVTIDESAELTLASDSVYGMEGMNVVICVMHARHNLERNVSVNIQLIEDSADFQDFAFSMSTGSVTTITFFAGDDTVQKCVNVSLTDDNITENNEVFNVTITPVDTSDTVRISTTTVIIMDNDGVTFVPESIEANETDVDQTVPLCVTMMPSTGGLDRNAVITYMDQELTFIPMQSVSQCFNVTITGDTLVENTEEFSPIFSTGNSRDEVEDGATITILDDDGATVMFVMASQTVSENSTASVCVELTDTQGGLRRSVPFTITDGGTVYPGEFSVTSVVGATTCQDIIVRDDNLIEDDMQRTLTLDVVDDNDLLGETTRHTLTIADNDGATVSFTVAAQEVSENAGSVNVCIELADVKDGLRRNVPVTITLARDVVYTLELPASGAVGAAVCQNISIINDTVVGKDEEMTFTLGVVNSNDLLGNITTHTITITDDDGAIIVVDSVSDVTETDMDQSIRVTFRVSEDSGMIERNVSFEVSLALGDAGDVSLSLQLVTLEPNSSTYTFNDFIEVIGDMLVEGNESISVMFTPVNELDMIQGSPLTFTIIDDDGATVRFQQENQTVSEGVGSVMVCVELMDIAGGLRRPVPFTITSDRNMTMSFEFSETASVGDTICRNVTIDDDTLIEGTVDRPFTLAVVNDNDAVGDIATHVIYVIDNDGATVSFETASQTVSENVGMAEVCAVLASIGGGLERAVPFTITSDMGMTYDYEFPLSAAVEERICLVVTIMNNSLVGNSITRSFTLNVINDNDLLGDYATHVITVEDDDGATISFQEGGQTVSEDVGTVMVCVKLTDVAGGLNRSVPFTIITARGMMPQFSFPASATVGETVCLNVTIMEDDYVEDTAMLRFMLVVTNGNDAIGEFDTHTITVEDNDGAVVQLSTSRVDLIEGNVEQNSGQICVRIISDITLVNRTVMVTASVASMSDNVDNIETFFYDTSVEIATGSNEACFSVSIMDDDVYTESVRYFVMSFSLANSNDQFTGSVEATVFIEDDDSPLINTKDYIPFVDIFEDDGAVLNELGETDDGCSSQIFMNSGLPYGSRSETSLRVCANGAISIGAGHFNFYSPTFFPSILPAISSANVLAPFWNDHDAQGPSSRILYKVYENSFGEMAREKIKNVSMLVEAQKNVSFTGVWMLVAEWLDVPAYPFSQNDLVNSYQALVITDGISTYAVYTYNCDRLQWSSGQGSSIYSVIGYNINSNNARSLTFDPFANHFLSGMRDVNTVACMNQRLRIDFYNLVYLVGFNDGSEQKFIADCINRANRDLLQPENPLFDYEQPCPCSFAQARRDSRYRYASSYLYSITEDISFLSQICYLQTFAPFRTNGAQLCCYSTRFFDYGALLDGSFGIEGSSYLRYHPGFYPDEYFEFDYQFKQSCCVDAGICEVYSAARPSDNCRFYRPQRRAWFWGDPHITTLDGRVFTFNGWGEYILMQFDTSNTQFTIQGRTQPVVNSTATQLVAFAFAMIRDQPVQVEVVNDSDLKVLFNGSDVTSNLTNTNDTYVLSTLRITRDGEKSLTASFPNGVGVTVSASFSMLSLVLIVPDEFRNITSGLMGDYNGIPDDDLVFRNGTMLSSNVSDRVIHEFGQSWEIIPDESLFTYPDDSGPANFSHPYHMPVFLDDIVANADPEVLAACGDNVECIFDFDQTGNEEIGMETLNTNMENEDDQMQASNNPPRITGPATLLVDLGVEARLVLNVSDDSNNFTVSILGGLPENSNLERTGPSEYIFTWMLNEIVNNTLEFEARDELNATAVHNVQVQICACENGGNCTINGIIGTAAGNILLNCECSEAWTGRFCEMDVDGCMEITCFMGVECTDVMAPGVGATCGVCPDGYLGDGDKCEDINECNGTTHGCAHTCENFDGGFECLCDEGFELYNEKECQDINECTMLNGGCHQVCENTIGGRNCSCNPGFELSEDMRTCTVLPSAVCSMNNSCDQTCVLINAMVQCGCYPGYMLGADNMTCNDVNECAQNPCDQVCTNTLASFECSCNDGYELQPDNTTCVDINECVNAGLRGETLCDPPMMCINKDGDDGKFECVCPPGTELMDSMCVTPTTAPPPTTPPPPPTGTVPPEFQDDAVVVTIPNLTTARFTAELRRMFREVTANALNTYCAENPCLPSLKRQAPRTVTADDVIMNNVRDNDAGHVTFDLYVRTVGDTALPATAVENAIESNIQEYLSLGITVEVELLIMPPTMAPVPVGLTVGQIVGIAVGCVVGALLLLFLVIIVVVCFVRCQSRRKSYDLNYGLNYDNPVADDGDVEPISVKLPDEEEESRKPLAEPNVYATSRDVTEEEPRTKTDAAAGDDEKRLSDRSMQSLILRFGEADDASQHSTEKEEFTTL